LDDVERDEVGGIRSHHASEILGSNRSDETVDQLPDGRFVLRSVVVDGHGIAFGGPNPLQAWCHADGGERAGMLKKNRFWCVASLWEKVLPLPLPALRCDEMFVESKKSRSS